MNLILRAAKQLASEITSATRWMFAPGGTHTITPAADEGSAEVTVKIDETTAAVLNASLAKINAENAPQRAFFDREHDLTAGATAWPRRFVWSESPQPGVYCEHEPSALGQQLVAGKIVRAFSPSFYSDAELPKRIARGKHVAVAAGKRGSPENPARMIGLVFPACGTLTNNPAFTQILPLWAKNAGASSATDNQPHNMKQTPEKLAALQARKIELEQSLPALRAAKTADDKNAAAAEAVEAAETELDTTEAKLNAHAAAVRNEELEAALRASRTKDAESAVAEAVKRGAIAARDTATQETWKTKCVEDPANLVLLASMRGSPALEARRITTPGLQITREDSVTVLRAYNAERDPRKKHAIFARDIKPRLKDGETLPLKASNTLGTLAGELIVQQALELLTLEQPLLSALTTNFSDTALNPKHNTEINTRIIGIPGTTAYNTTTGYATENTVTTDVPLTINRHYSCQVEFGEEELAGTNRRLFDELAPAMAYAIGKEMTDYALSLITAGNYTNTATTKALIDFDRASVISMGGALSDRGVPSMGRTLLLTGTYYDKLFSDDQIVLLAANQKADLITGSRMIPLHDFNVLRAPTLPTTGNLAGFGFSKSALVLAARVPSDYANAFPGVTGGGISQVVTNPQSGLSMHLVQFVDHQLGQAFMRLASMYGAAKGQINAGQRLVSA